MCGKGEGAMKASARVALCGMCAAVCTVILFLTGLAPMATIALPALAGCVLIPVTAQLGVKWGLGVYAVCTVLELLWVPDREAAVYFALFLLLLCVGLYFAFFRSAYTGTNADEKLSK